MAFTFSDIVTSVTSYLQDDAKFLAGGELDRAIQDAGRQLNHDRPFRLVKDIAGDGTQDYALPAEFEKGFSDVDSVEVPAGEVRPVFRQREDDWFIYEDPTKSPPLRLRFKETTPGITEIIRIIIFASYSLNKTANTTSLDQDAFMAVVYKTLVLLFRALGARFTESVDPTIGADTVDRASLSQNYLFLAAENEKNYKQITGLNGKVKAAQAFADADIIYNHGEDFVWHPARTR